MSQQTTRQRQTLQQEQRQKTKPQQVLAARLLEMSMDRLEERIEEEKVVNPYLKSEAPQPAHKEKEEDERPLTPEPLPTNSGGVEMETANAVVAPSLYDHLTAQLADYTLSDEARELVAYLIGCVDSNGYLSLSLPAVADDLFINHNIDVKEDRLEAALHTLQAFDPAGVGGRTTQECLLLQAQRLSSPQEKRVFTRLFSPRNYDDFTHQRWGNIEQRNHFSAAEMSLIRRRVRKFNPYPGRSFATDDHAEVIRPDFIVHLDGHTIELQLAKGNMPVLSIDEYALAQDTCKADKSGVRLYRGYAETAHMFLLAIQQRRETLLRTMKAIIMLQRPFFLEGDTALLRPMTLEDVSAQTGQNISTVSRAAKGKYVATPYGTYPLRWFFSQATKHEEEDISTRAVMQALKELIEREPKDAPLSDEKLSAELQRQGYKVARRTVVKYRDQMGIPTSGIRKRRI